MEREQFNPTERERLNARARVARSRALDQFVRGLTVGTIVAAVVVSAIVAKESRGRGRAMVGTEFVRFESPAVAAEPVIVAAADVGPPTPLDDEVSRFVADAEVRWFNGRPVRPDRVIWMKVTAYTPGEESCGTSADGKTATMHCVTTNASRLVAADPKVLPYGTMVSVPGYAQGLIVPVLDCGGAIKGDRLDLLFPTVEEARRWGVKTVPVTIYGYADGLPADDPRKLR